MIWNKTIITQHECGLVLKDKRIQKILEPGVYWTLRFASRIDVISTKQAEVTNANLLDLIDSNLDQDKHICEQYLQVIDLNEYEVALVYQRGVLKSVLQAGQRHVYWKDKNDLSIEVVNTKDTIQIEPDLAKVLVRKNGVTGAITSVYPVEVSSDCLLYTSDAADD